VLALSTRVAYLILNIQVLLTSIVSEDNYKYTPLVTGSEFKEYIRLMKDVIIEL
jgi:hypothetical protein